MSDTVDPDSNGGSPNNNPILEKVSRNTSGEILTEIPMDEVK